MSYVLYMHGLTKGLDMWNMDMNVKISFVYEGI